MKRNSAIIVLLVMLTSVLSCAHMTETPATVPDSPVLNRIMQNKELVVGTAASMPPFNMKTKDGQIIGMDVDLARYMAAALNVELRLEPRPFSELIPALESGDVDMVVSNMTITPKRNLKVAFVGPYFISGKALLTKMETLASIKDPSEVDSVDIKLAALKDSTSQDFIEKLIPRATLVTTENYDEAVKLVIQGKVDAMIADYPICMLSVLRYPDEGLLSVISPFTYEPIGIALPPHDPLMVNLVQNFLTTFKDSSGLKALKKRWFEDGAWLKELP